MFHFLLTPSAHECMCVRVCVCVCMSVCLSLYLWGVGIEQGQEEGLHL